MLRLLPLAIVLALPISAQAQLASYCDGRLQLTAVDTQPTASGLEYFASFRNNGTSSLTVTVSYRGGLTDRPNRPVPFTAGNVPTRVKLGRQAPGSPRLLLPQVIPDILMSGC